MPALTRFSIVTATLFLASCARAPESASKAADFAMCSQWRLTAWRPRR